MPENEMQKPEDVLKDILNTLKSDDTASRLNGIARLHELNYSSEAVRNELEKLALHDSDSNVRKEALHALDLATQKYVASKTNKLNIKDRHLISQEIEDWEKSGLLQKENADILRKRYEFDVTPAIKSPKAESQRVESTGEVQAQAEITPAPQPTLTQILLSETSIKIALYLGAFFVISSATIFAALVEMARLPILIVGTLFFGGLAIALKKKLPQPSFALFIVFSFLLPITANVLEELLKLSISLTALYWVIVCLLMAFIWAGGTWLYESRMFSIAAFISFSIALTRVGDIFNAADEFYLLMLGFAALTGLIGAWMLKKWRDSKFSQPLFIAAQILQVSVILSSTGIYFSNLINQPANPLWNLAHILIWGLAFAFYAFSENLSPFFLFPWIAGGTLIGLPWFASAAFEMTEFPRALLFFVWSLVIATTSEGTEWLEKTRKYNLPILLASILASFFTLVFAFTNKSLTGFLCALSFSFIYAILHYIRPRGWLWAIALLHFVISYFAFFTLPEIETADVFFGYQLLGLSIFFLLPELLTRDKTADNIKQRLAPMVLQIYGAFFTILAFTIYTFGNQDALKTSVMFWSYTLFFGIYAFGKGKAIYGYLPAVYLPLSIIFVLKHFDIDAWLPALTILSIIYFLTGEALRKKETWSSMLKNSGLILGSLLSAAALILAKEYSGWYVLVIGLLFAIQTASSKNGWFEIGAPILFSIGVYLILKDFNIREFSYHLLVYSAIWLISDIAAHLFFNNIRPLKSIIRIIAATLVFINYAVLIFSLDSRVQSICFGVYTLLFALVNIAYRKPQLLYTFTVTLPLFTIFLLQEFEIIRWSHFVILLAIGYYALGFSLRALRLDAGWDLSLIFSGLGIGVAAALGAWNHGGLDAAIPTALAATLFAVEAFARKNVWLGFPANALYLLAYFIILIELKVDQPQFFSVGAALLGMIQHYFLTRAESKTGIFIMGMVSQLTLLGTTYIQMADTENLGYFFVLFLQAMTVIVYGVIIRSRSLVFTPIGIIVLGLFTVLYSALKGISAVILVGCSGFILLILGILAVLMRERITKVSEKLSGWKA